MMFFVLSKLLSWCIQPLSWCMLLGLAAWTLYRRRSARWLLALMLLLLYGASAPVTSRFLLQWLEEPYREPGQLQHYDLVIVLTGMVRLHLSRPGYVEFNEHVERILTGISLVKRGVADKLLIAGGSADPWHPELSEARMLRPFAIEFGLTDEQILTEEHSRNTYENAVNAARIIRAQHFQKLLLVTSASHMARSAGVFRQQGLFPDLYAVDFYSRERPGRWSDVFPSAAALAATSNIVHELIGIAMYRFQGYL